MPFPCAWCRALGTLLVQSPVHKQNCVAASAFYLSALNMNLEVEDILYLITVFLIHHNAVESLFEISCERGSGREGPGGYIFSPFSFW